MLLFFLVGCFLFCLHNHSNEQQNFVPNKQNELARKELNDIERSVQRFYSSQGKREIKLRLEYARVHKGIPYLISSIKTTPSDANNNSNQNN